MYAIYSYFIHDVGEKMKKDTFEDFKSELKQKNDIVSIVSRYVPLDKRGSYFWCRCPFHGEKTASLCVNDVDNMFYCYGCHTGGDVIKFVQLIESCSFMDAVRMLANWANMEVPESFNGSTSSEEIAKAKKRRDRLYALTKAAAMHYHENLMRPSAEPARAYMKKRELSEQVATRFGLGYSESYTEMIDYLKKLGYNEAEMLSAGVVKRKESDGRVFDPLANRLIFPIIDVAGHVIAFGGRTLEAHPQFAKYLNTQETEIFSKSNTLYAINYLKKQRQQGPIPYIIVVEGYMDTISLHKVGFTMAVASMGTSLTQNQAKIMKRFVDKVYICYDGDSAGQNATLRGLDILKENGLDVMVMQLPDKFDPDDVIKAYGKEGYQKLIDKALPLIEFKIKYLSNKYDISSVDGRVKFLSEAIEVLSEISSAVERELYIPMVSEIAATNMDFVRKEVQRKLDGKPIISEIKAGLQNVTKIDVKQEDRLDGPRKTIEAEKYVLAAMIHRKPYAHFNTDVAYLFSDKLRDVYYNVCKFSEDNPGSNLVEILNDYYADDNQSIIADIVNSSAIACEDDSNSKKYYDDCLWTIYKFYLENKLKELSYEYSDEIDTNKRTQIGEKMLEITKKLKNKEVDKL